MGMYTYLRFTGELKKEYVEEIKNLFDFEKANRDNDDFNEWKHFAEKHDFATHFASLRSPTSIPFGGFSAYNIDKASSNSDDEPTFSNVIWNNGEYTWVFQCDLKNYDGEIDTFLKEVAPNICKKFVAEKWYEEADFPTIYIYGVERELVEKGEVMK